MRKVVQKIALSEILFRTNKVLAEYAGLLDAHTKNDEKIFYINRLRVDIDMVSKNYTQSAE